MKAIVRPLLALLKVKKNSSSCSHLLFKSARKKYHFCCTVLWVLINTHSVISTTTKLGYRTVPSLQKFSCAPPLKAIPPQVSDNNSPVVCPYNFIFFIMSHPFLYLKNIYCMDRSYNRIHLIGTVLMDILVVSHLLYQRWPDTKHLLCARPNAKSLLFIPVYNNPITLLGSHY